MSTELKTKLDDLLARRQTAFEAAEAIMETARAANRDLTAEELQSWTRAKDDVLALNDQVTALRSHLGLVEDLATVQRGDIPVDEPEPGTREQKLHDTPAYRAAFDLYLRRGAETLRSEQRQILEEARANLPQASGDDTLGGYLVPTEFANKIIEEAHTYNGVIQAGADVLTTGTGVEIQYPTSNDDEEGEIVAENAAVSGLEIIFGMRPIAAHIFSSKMVKVPRSLLADSRVNLEQFVRTRLGKRIGRRQGRAYVTGTGVGEPQGIVTAAAVAHTAAATNAITYVDLVAMRYSIDEAYEDRARWMFKRDTLAALMRLTDNDGRPLLNWSPVADAPDTILGKPFTTSAHMATLAAGNKPVLFGDFSGYLVREVDGVEILRLVERYAENFQIAFIGFHRADGALVDLGAVKSMQMAAV